MPPTHRDIAEMVGASRPRLIKLELQPDFGWFDILITPFLPEGLRLARSKQQLELA